MARRYLLSILVIVGALNTSPCNAQTYFFSSLSTGEGLPSNTTGPIAQDNYGFMWIGSSAGLSRYDGYNFKTFKRGKEKHSLVSSEISALLVDGDLLWVGTWQGLCRINTRTFIIERISLPGNNAIRCLAMDKTQRLWIGTDNGLVCYDNRTFAGYTTENSTLSNNTVRVIYEDRQHKLWIGTNNKLNLFDEENKNFEHFDFHSSKTRIIYDIKQSNKSDSLWIGSEGGLFFLNPKTKNYHHFTSENSSLSSDAVKSIYTGDPGVLWLGTEFGLNLLHLSSTKADVYFHHPGIVHSLASNEIWQIIEDRGGIIWIATSNGISRTSKLNDQFTYQEVTHSANHQSLGNQVKSMLISKQGYMWLATIHGLICMNDNGTVRDFFDVQSGPAKRILSNNIFSVAEDSLGRIWIGTSDGINVWDDQKKLMYAIKASKENGLGGNFIAHISDASDGAIWVSVWESGLFKVKDGLENLNAIRFDYAGPYSSEKYVNGNGAVWTIWDDSLYHINPTSYDHTKVQSFNTVADGKDLYNIGYFGQSVWIGTLNGLFEYKPESDSTLYYPILTGDDVAFNNLIGDDSKNIWAATYKSIVRFSRTDKKLTVFPLQKELPFKAFFRNCSALDRAGNIFFGGDNGVIRFRPDIEPSKYVPPVYISKLNINEENLSPGVKQDGVPHLTEDISFTHNLTLKYSQRSLTASFAALHFGQPEINMYAYKLEGFDNDWKYTSGKTNFAVYSNLFPGTYTLRVRGTNNYGVWSDQQATLTITVMPPIMLSPAFIIAYIGILIFAVFLGLRIYAVRIKLKSDLRLALFEKQNAEVVIQTKQQFFTGVSHELKTPISMIVPPLQQVLQDELLGKDSRRMVSLAAKNSMRLLRIVNQILDFRRLEQDKETLHAGGFDLSAFCREIYSLFSDRAARNDIDFVFICNSAHLEVFADQHKIETIVYNLLSNAFKFTPKRGRIDLSINKYVSFDSANDNMVTISVRDTGIGIPKEDHDKIFDAFFQSGEGQRVDGGSGIGLTLVKEYSIMHGGRIELISEKGLGSNFTVYLPILRELSSVQDFDRSSVDLKHIDGATETVERKTRKPLVLLVDDNSDILEFIEIALKEKYIFAIADNGKFGLEQAIKYNPDLIISDIMMPIMDGLEFCRHIKDDKRLRSIPIIMLTAKSFVKDQIEGLRTGADVYITKPFEISLLNAHIEQLLKRKAELTEYFRRELITTPVTSSNGTSEDDVFLKKVMDAIEANLSNTEFSVEVLSEHLGMSSAHLGRKLKSLTSLVPNEIIKKYRLKKASQLLKNKQGNITEIMDEVGFDHLSYFSKCFKHEFGVSPKEFQQRETRSGIDPAK